VDETYSQFFGNWSTLALVALVVVLLVIVFIGTIVTRAKRSNRLDNVLGMSIEDISDMRSKGLLTPEETAKVRAAMARQMARSLSQKPTFDSLGSDPEILRLEELARQKREAREAGALPLNWETSDAPVPSGGNQSTADDDVQLPPDVMSMADLGLITPEELERIKDRIRSKKSESGLT